MSNPTSFTPALPMTAIALDGRISLDRCVQAFARPVALQTSFGRVLQRDATSQLYLFELGAVVFDGTGPTPELRSEIERATGRSCLLETAETTWVVVDPQHRDHPRVGWDRVTIPRESPALLAVTALLLAQSAALERYEHVVEELLADTLVLARALESTGRAPWRTRHLIRRTGRVLVQQLEQLTWFYLVDRPEETWEDQEVAALYDGLFANLELGARHGGAVQKYAAIQDANRLIVDLWQGQRGAALEWAIIALIAVEIGLLLLGW